VTDAVLLDTHAWLWWIAGDSALSAPAAAAIQEAADAGGVHLSAISAWELALLVKRGRIQITMSAEQLVQLTTRLPFVHMVDLDERMALASVAQAEPVHKDPADRFLAATSRLLGVPLVTADARLRSCSDLDTIW